MGCPVACRDLKGVDARRKVLLLRFVWAGTGAEREVGPRFVSSHTRSCRLAAAGSQARQLGHLGRLLLAVLSSYNYLTGRQLALELLP